ncbi:phage tail protein [Parasphingorhabdus sp.]|uniref:phage tail protein n=1 Tax=Parasphingorhabdus sp. TaxID=2709688 RepID=UPI003C73BA86
MALTDRPYSVFNFAVEIYPDGASAPLAEAAFTECDGLEMTMDVQTIREGGANDRAYRVPSVINYSNLSLKRGMTANRELWNWFTQSNADPFLRADAELVMFAEDGKTEKMRFRLSRCIPIKMKVPPLNAKDGGIAIEDFALAYEKFELVEAAAGGPAE